MKVGDWVEFINIDKSPYGDEWYKKYLNKPMQIRDVGKKGCWFQAPVGYILSEYDGVPLIRHAQTALLKTLKQHLR